MRHADRIRIQHPWTNITTTKGSAPWIQGANDGVVTLNSQRHHAEGMELVDLDYNHYEVVLSDRAIELIRERIPKNTP